jgi:MoaA/NifB/PqqE/SkfB family radical SAM enzyme
MTNHLASAYNRVYRGINYRLRSYCGGRWAHRCRPNSIGFLLTERCNARCVHCDIWKNRGKEHSPTVEQWRGVLSDVRKWLGPVHVTFSGGEALLQPFTTDLVAHASSLGLMVEVLTHGYWHDQTRIQKLALAKPWRVTVSLDAASDTHSKIRGRENFFQKTAGTIDTLRRMRNEMNLNFDIRLKTVIMAHNLDEVAGVAHYASDGGMDVFYQPIEQNYNTVEDARWFEHGENWPKDTNKAVAVVEELIRLKRSGFPIANGYPQLEAMVPYFRNPDAWRVSTQAHSAHEQNWQCSALTMLQLQSNGDVTICEGLKPVGNVKEAPIRQIWENRPRVWEQGCCRTWRCSPAEKQVRSLPILS